MRVCVCMFACVSVCVLLPENVLVSCAFVCPCWVVLWLKNLLFAQSFDGVGKANSLLLCCRFTFDRSQRKYHWIFICLWIFIHVADEAKKKHPKCSLLSEWNTLHAAPVSTLFTLDQSSCIICSTSKQSDMPDDSAYAQVQAPCKSGSTLYCWIWRGISFFFLSHPSDITGCLCLFSILHHLWHLYRNNTTPSSTQCVENIQFGSSEKRGFFSFFDHLAQQVQEADVEEKKTHILSSCLKRFINELNMSERNLFSLPSCPHPTPSSRHVLGKTPRQWFKLNGVCQTCQLIKWGFALSMHFSVTALFHWRSQLSTPSYSQ